MENHIKVQKVTQDVMMFVWFQHGVIEKEPVRDMHNLIPEVSKEFMVNLSTSVWIESYRTLFIYNDFFEKHFERMISSSKLFASYVGFVCYILKRCTDPHECFFDILSFVTDVSIRCIEKDQKAHLNTCVDLFCAFYEKELRMEFEAHGGWKKLNEYLFKQYNLIEFKSLASDESPEKLFDYFREAHDKSLRTDRVDSCGIAYKKRIEPHFFVNGVVLKNITQKQIETNEKAISFGESVQKKMDKLLLKTFHELTIEFSKTCKQVKDLYQWTFVGAAEGKARKIEKPLVQKEVPKDIPKKTDAGAKQLESKTLTATTTTTTTTTTTKTSATTLKTKNLDTSKTKEVVSTVEPSPLQPKSTKRGIAETLLGNMSDALNKLFEIIQPLFEEYGLEVSDVFAGEVRPSIP